MKRKLSEVLKDEPETLERVRKLCKMFNAQEIKLVDNLDYYDNIKERKREDQ